MKTKLLKKVRKEYTISYRKEPYKVIHNIIDCKVVFVGYNYKLIIPNRAFFLFRYNIDYSFLKIDCENINDAKDYIIQNLRRAYPNLGNYNRQRKIKETEHKVWYNGI